ncbi:MAG: hypothetical protein RLZ12_765 [Bacillota bacterium]
MNLKRIIKLSSLFISIPLVLMISGCSSNHVPTAENITDQNLIDAIEQNDGIKVRAALASGINPNARTKSSFFGLRVYDHVTALHYAVTKGHIRAIEALIANDKTDVNVQNDYQETPLHYAAQCCPSRSATEIVKKLLATKKVVINAKDWLDDTPLHIASNEGRTDIVAVLLDNSTNVNERNNSQKTPLHLAASKGYADIVAKLLAKGADYTLLDSDNQTALDLAQKNNHPEVIKLLTKKL